MFLSILEKIRAKENVEKKFSKKNFEIFFFEIVITPSFYVQKWLFTTKIDKNSKNEEKLSSDVLRGLNIHIKL